MRKLSPHGEVTYRCFDWQLKLMSQFTSINHSTCEWVNVRWLCAHSADTQWSRDKLNLARPVQVYICEPNKCCDCFKPLTFDMVYYGALNDWTFVKSTVLDIFFFEMPMKGHRGMVSGKVRKLRKDLGEGHMKYSLIHSLIHLAMKWLERHFQKRKWIGVVRKAEMGSLIRKLVK